MYLVSKLIPDESVSTYHILFPDPWPKRRHQARRLISPDFLVDAQRTMTPDAFAQVRRQPATRQCGQLRHRPRGILRVDSASVRTKWAVCRNGTRRLAAGSAD